MRTPLAYTQPSYQQIKEYNRLVDQLGYEQAFHPTSGNRRGWRLWRPAIRPFEMQDAAGNPVLFADYGAAYQAAIEHNTRLLDEQRRA